MSLEMVEGEPELVYEKMDRDWADVGVAVAIM
jgi:hypothetical protein